MHEPALAMTRANRIAVAQHFSLGGPLRYALGSNQHATWSSGPIPGIHLQDPTTCVVDGTQGQNRFAIFGITATFGSENALWYSIYAPGTTPEFTVWRRAYKPAAGQAKVDKPWVIQRAPGDFFVFFYRGGPAGYAYLRSANGQYWGEEMNELPRYDVAGPGGGAPIPGSFCCQPAVGPDGAIYLAYATDEFGPSGANGRIQLLRGTDPEGDHSGPLEFTHLLGEDGQPVSISPHHSQNQALPVPAATLEPICKTVPYLLCDSTGGPFGPDRLYVLYHDTAEPGSSDVDAMIARYTRNPVTDRWSVVTGELSTDLQSPSGQHADQFLPVGVVDSQGRVHVIYYDNRPDERSGCTQEDGYGPAFDVYYAVSADGGQAFATYNLRTDCEASRPLDFSLQRPVGSSTGPGVEAGWSPREYNGMAFYEANGVTRIWLVYSGAVADPSIPDDPNAQSLMWGQQVVVGGAP